MESKLLGTLVDVIYIVGYSDFFLWEAKKRDVSDKSRDEEDLKKVKESDSISFLPHEDFSDGLNSPELAKLLANWLKSIENPVKELFTSHEEEKESLIKVNEPLEFMTAKFDDLERKSRKKMKRLLSQKKPLKI